MIPKKLPTEFAINMHLDKLIVLQQSELDMVSKLNYFDENSPCHIYLIGKRPRVIVEPKAFKATDKTFEFLFKIQKQDIFIDFPLITENPFNDSEIKLESEYPYTLFKIMKGEEVIYTAKTAVYLQTFERYYAKTDFLDLEILYIGQSYGVDGARTAPERLKSHSTLQGIYATAMQKNPDFEIWLMLTSFSQTNITKMDGISDFSQKELEDDKKRFMDITYKLNYEGMNEQQRINFTEAALIRYFEPQYNIEYKNSFPNPAHKTYSECYELDINSIGIELETMEQANFNIFTKKAKANWLHMETFFLHSPKERKDMFDII